MAKSNLMRHSLWICWKDLLEFTRNRIALVMLILMPLLMMAMVGFIFPSASAVSNTPVALADLDEGMGNITMGHQFAATLEGFGNASGLMNMKPAADFDDIKTKIQNAEVSGGIIIEKNFTQNLLTGKQAYVTIVTDQSNPQMATILQQILSKTIESIGTMYAQYSLNSTYQAYGVNLTATPAMITPYKVNVEGIVPGTPSYFQFMAPGVMAMVVMMSMMTGLPHAISYEKDIGTMDGLMVAPIRRLSIILGKVLAQTVRGMIQGIIILIMAVAIFGVVIYGNIALVFFILFLCVFSFVGLGILITSFTDKEETASMVMMTLMFPMMFLSGVFFPIQQMPWYMQDIANVLPLTYATSALRNVMVLGSDVSAIAFPLTFLIVFGIVMLGIAIPMFKKGMAR
jgi:ABC-2 type transport system permease protein